jgi:hypothetical protein
VDWATFTESLPPSPRRRFRCGAAFVLRARRSSQSEGGLRASNFADFVRKVSSKVEGYYVGQDGGQAGTSPQYTILNSLS